MTQGDLSSAITKIEEAIKPLGEYVLSQRGARESTQRTEDRMQPWMLWVAATSVMFFLAIITVALKFV